jgi:hypothetical protein
MTLKEKFKKVNAIDWIKQESALEIVADDYAIEFAHWCEWQDGKAFKTFQELLEIFKKEKGL